MEDNLLMILKRKQENLSKTQKKLAEYIEENIHSIPFLSIKELSEKSDVSLASITRFTRQLGLEGYSEFQKKAGELLKKEVIPMKEFKSSISSNNDENVLRKLIDLNIKSLQGLYNEEIEKSFDESIDIIKKSRKLYICASRSSYSVAYYLYFMLKGFIENVDLISNGMSDSSNKLQYIKNEDCLIAISYSRYTKATYDITSFFYDMGCKIISITDSYSAPIALKSTTVLLAKNSLDSYSFVSAMTIANSLVTALGKIDKDETLKRLEKQDEIAIKNNIYL